MHCVSTTVSTIHSLDTSPQLTNHRCNIEIYTLWLARMPLPAVMDIRHPHITTIHPDVTQNIHPSVALKCYTKHAPGCSTKHAPKYHTKHAPDSCAKHTPKCHTKRTSLIALMRASVYRFFVASLYWEKSMDCRLECAEKTSGQSRWYTPCVTMQNMVNGMILHCTAIPQYGWQISEIVLQTHLHIT